MELFFIRHGIAIDREDPNIASDEERRLTKDGIEKMEQTAKGLARIVAGLDEIFSSPYARAKQTAEIVAKAFKPKPPISLVSGMAPGMTLEILEGCAEKHSAGASLAFVGHEPDMSRMISLLVTGGDHCGFDMKKGAVACVGVESQAALGAGVLLWLLQPKHLRKIC
ncbi:MAG: phosphohistidine phosphatase SixA [Candidatus Omnitrophota bacterium]